MKLLMIGKSSATNLLAAFMFACCGENATLVSQGKVLARLC